MRLRRALRALPLAIALLTAPALAAGLPQARADAGWQWPLRGPVQVVRGFEPPAHDWMPGHRGVDLAGRPGDRVLAAGGGRVVFAGYVGRIPAVSVRHPGGLETTYEPVRPLVHVGSHVGAGAVLGVLLAAGSHCTPATCLHWGLRRDRAYLDPLTLLGVVRVRLLPLLSGSHGPSWLTPAVSGASVGSSAVVVTWAGIVLRRRRRPLPPGVASLAAARRRRADAHPPPGADARA
jgi:murein DD-endopeptidase MepM/ murein hydrolase activator NlpD